MDNEIKTPVTTISNRHIQVDSMAAMEVSIIEDRKPNSYNLRSNPVPNLRTSDKKEQFDPLNRILKLYEGCDFDNAKFGAPFSSQRTSELQLGKLRRKHGSSAVHNTDRLRQWQPKGILVAHLQEHASTVTQLAVSADSQFFVSASTDGTVKIWDCNHLERSITNRSQFTYDHQHEQQIIKNTLELAAESIAITIQGGVQCVTILDNSHTVASGSFDGSVHIFRVDSSLSSSTSSVSSSTKIKYAGTTPIGNICAKGSIMQIGNFGNRFETMVAFATSKGIVHGWDLRCKLGAWQLANQTSKGVISAMCIDPQQNWIIIGTNRGHYVCWDIRFQIEVKSWQHPTSGSINALALHQGVMNTSVDAIYAAVNSEIYLWDLETAECKSIISISNSCGKPEEIFAATCTNDNQTYLQDICAAVERQKACATKVTNSSPSMRCLLSLNNNYSSNNSRFLISGSSDRCLRYWNFSAPNESYIISGVRHDLAKAHYSTAKLHGNNISTLLEKPAENVASSISILNTSIVEDFTPISRSSPSSTARTNANVTVNHHDSITDIQLINLSRPLLVSSSRDGVIKVWK